MLLYKSTGNGWRPDESFSRYNRVLIGSQFRRRIWATASTERRNSDKRRKDKVGIVPKKKLGQLRQHGQQRSLLTVYQNGDPLGRKDLGKGDKMNRSRDEIHGVITGKNCVDVATFFDQILSFTVALDPSRSPAPSEQLVNGRRKSF